MPKGIIMYTFLYLKDTGNVHICTSTEWEKLVKDFHLTAEDTFIRTCVSQPGGAEACLLQTNNE